MEDDVRRYAQQNRRAWNKIARVRDKKFPQAEFFRQGGSTLAPLEIEAAGTFRGKRPLHLQCATGEDMLSWAIMGAQAIGMDISDEQIILARRKAKEAGLRLRISMTCSLTYRMQPLILSLRLGALWSGCPTSNAGPG